jgi:hypothetical protein
MPLSIEQIMEMAPDGNSAAAGKKLMAERNWDQLGQNAKALWGLCRGSAVYQVKVDLGNFGYHCSCPSRKFPCKHVLGLLMLWATSPGAVSTSESPEWVGDWLGKRKQREEKKVERQETETKKPVDERAQQRRAEQRESRVSEGLARFGVWLADLVRNGLATVETKPASFWDEQAKRLVDAQAPGLALRVARLAGVPRSSRDWPRRLLAELGRIALLLHAWERIGGLAPPLQSDVRQMLGWNISQAELERNATTVEDTWAVIGQWVDSEDRIRVQRSWLRGRATHGTALVLQFAAGTQPFAESIVPGSEQKATLAYYPGAVRQRAKYLSREGALQPVTSRLPGENRIEMTLAVVSEQIAHQPWLGNFGVVLHDVTFVPQAGQWFVCDGDGRALPLLGREHWRSLAITAGHPFDMTGEWDGEWLRPLGLFVNNVFRVA